MLWVHALLSSQWVFSVSPCLNICLNNVHLRVKFTSNLGRLFVIKECWSLSWKIRRDPYSRVELWLNGYSSTRLGIELYCFNLIGSRSWQRLTYGYILYWAHLGPSGNNFGVVMVVFFYRLSPCAGPGSPTRSIMNVPPQPSFLYTLFCVRAHAHPICGFLRLRASVWWCHFWPCPSLTHSDGIRVK